MKELEELTAEIHEKLPRLEAFQNLNNKVKILLDKVLTPILNYMSN